MRLATMLRCCLFVICFYIFSAQADPLRISTTGDCSVSYSGNGPWDPATDLNIGITSPGALNIQNNGIVSFTNNADYVNIGYGNDATVNILSGGQLNCLSSIRFGKFGVPGDVSVTVSGTGSKLTAESGFLIGSSNCSSNLTIQNGAYASSAFTYIGTNLDEPAKVTITGTGSCIETTYATIIGNGGNASLVIDNSGSLISGTIYLGNGTGSNGTLEVKNGANVLITSSTGLGIGVSDNSTASVTLTGTDSMITADCLTVGGITSSVYGTGIFEISDNAIANLGKMYIMNGSTLKGGGGTIIATDAVGIMNHGTISPGNSIGTINIIGDYIHTSTATYLCEIDDAGNSDLINITGAAEIQGGTIKVIPLAPLTADDISQGSSYTVLTATGGVTGGYSVKDTATIDFDLAYEATNVKVNIGNVSTFAEKAITPNQSGVAGVLDTLKTTSNSADMTGTVIPALQGLATDQELRNALNQVSGQTRPGLSQVTNAGNGAFNNNVSRRMHTVRSGLAHNASTGQFFADAGSSSDTITDVSETQNFAIGNGSDIMSDKSWGIWGRGHAIYGDRESQSQTVGYDYRIYGSSYGVDYQLTENFLIGVTGGYSDSRVRFFGSSDSSDITTNHIGLYSSYEKPDWYFDSLLTYSMSEYETKRYLNFGGINRIAKGKFDGTDISGYFEGGLKRYYKDILIQPLISFQFDCIHQDSYTETGAGALNLSYDDLSTQSYKGSVGLKAAKDIYKKDDKYVNLELRSRWIHEFGDASSSVSSSFASDPGNTFNISDDKVSRDSAVLGVGITAKLWKSTIAYFDYDNQFNNDQVSHIFSAGMEYRW